MNLDIKFKNSYYLKLPHSSDEKEIAKMKGLIGTSSVDAFSIDTEIYKIIKGKGSIKNNGSYNYHNNYDDSEDEMFFDNKTQWFTLNEDRVKEVFNQNAAIIRKMLEKKLEEYKEI